MKSVCQTSIIRNNEAFFYQVLNYPLFLHVSYLFTRTHSLNYLLSAKYLHIIIYAYIYIYIFGSDLFCSSDANNSLTGDT